MTAKKKEEQLQESFEDAMKRLEQVVRGLESGDLSLDDSLKTFEQGISLVRLCEQKLTEAKGKVEKLLAVEGSVAKTESFTSEN